MVFTIDLLYIVGAHEKRKPLNRGQISSSELARENAVRPQTQNRCTIADESLRVDERLIRGVPEPSPFSAGGALSASGTKRVKDWISD
jgi:hypothetical protein